MKNPLARLPWFIGAPGFLGALLVAAFVANYLGADYFKRTRLEEANPLAGASSSATGGPGTEVVSGAFRDGEPGHRGSGQARVIRGADGALTLRVEAFSVTNGPDLFVVLSKSEAGYSAEGALNLGELKATDGNFNYSIPAGTDLADYKSVVIWCRQFDVTFALAPLLSSSAAQPDPPMTQVAAQAASTPTPSSQASASAVPQPTQPSPTAPPLPTQAPVPTATVPPSGPQVLSQGAFRDGEPGHRGSGTASLGRDANGKAVLVIENFSVTNGPDLRVILGTNPNGGGEGIDLGKLKATDGTFSYAVPDGTDLTQIRSVTIWCAAFPTVFAVATLGA